MRSLTRRGMLGLGAGAAAAVSLAGCGGLTGSDGPGRAGGSRGGRSGTPDPKPSRTVRPIGDGSTSFTGKQPHQPDKPVPLEPGQTPPQFVVSPEERRAGEDGGDHRATA